MLYNTNTSFIYLLSFYKHLYLYLSAVRNRIQNYIYSTYVCPYVPTYYYVGVPEIRI